MGDKCAAVATIQLETPKRLHSNPNHHVCLAQKRLVKEDEEEVVPYNQPLYSVPGGRHIIDSPHHFRTFSENVERQCASWARILAVLPMT